MNQPAKMFTKTIQPNPKLEGLRKEGLEEPRVDYDINQLLDKTKRLHAGWLFDFNYLPLLQKLLRLLDGNFDTYHTPGWGSFGHHLGLSSEILRVIECSKLGNEGYTYYVLQHYIQKDDATIQKIIQALVDMKRKDVIHQTYSCFNSLANDILQAHQGNRRELTSINQQSDEDSGIYSLSITSSLANDILQAHQGNRRELTSINQQSDEDSGIYSLSITSNGEDENRERMQRNVESIIRPNFIPTPPLVLQELKEHVHRAITVSTIPQSPKIEHQFLQNSEPTIVTRNVQAVQHNDPEKQQQKVVPRYDCKVMLTFAADGINYATEVAKSLRVKREDGQNIGVLILNEHEKLVSSNPELFISGSFPQVDYVIPIITEGYLKAAMDTRPPFHIESLYIDCKYVRFIYTLMNKYYVNNGCLNKKIRCVIPDDLTLLTNKTMMREPIFETWVKSSSVDKLAERMLWRCRRKRNSRQQIIES